jgi:hypothetical protein
MFHFDYKDYSFWCNIGNMTYNQYVKMIELLESYKPKRICELGSGQSTEIFDVYKKKYNSQVYSIEHDKYYNTHHSIMFDLIENTKLYNYDKCNIYKGLEDWINNQDKFDFILIDGPNDGIMNNDNLQYGRIQLLDFILLNKLTDNSIILYHDSNLSIYQNTLNEFEKLLSQNKYKFNKEIIKETNENLIQNNINILGFCPELTIYKIQKELQ